MACRRTPQAATGRTPRARRWARTASAPSDHHRAAPASPLTPTLLRPLTFTRDHAVMRPTTRILAGGAAALGAGILAVGPLSAAVRDNGGDGGWVDDVLSGLV